MRNLAHCCSLLIANNKDTDLQCYGKNYMRGRWIVTNRNNTYGPCKDILQSAERASNAGIIGKAHMIAF